MPAEARLRELGLELPPPPRPMGSYVPAVRTGNLLFLSGHGPLADGRPAMTGRVGAELSLEDGQRAARLTGLNLLATARATLGSLDRVRRVVKVFGLVSSAETFIDHPKVVNGCSDLMVQVFGDAGLHARSAVGVGSLPFGIPVEIEMVLEVVGSRAAASGGTKSATAAASRRPSSRNARRRRR
jgi:enamine deaminase RidA (YjgF/YER057c/UK114 family)